MGMPENISYKDKNIEKIILRTDPEFLKVFNFPIIKGSMASALSGIHNIVLDESTAKAIFGETDPIGKELGIGKMGEEQIYTVSAILKDCPRNSSIRFDAVARMESLPNYTERKKDWGSNFSNVFVKLSKN